MQVSAAEVCDGKLQVDYGGIGAPTVKVGIGPYCRSDAIIHSFDDVLVDIKRDEDSMRACLPRHQAVDGNRRGHSNADRDARRS